MSEKVIKYKKPVNLNIGIVIFFFIIIYVVFNIFSYVTRVTISEYQVSQGTIASNNIYRGFILREEEVFYSEKSGFINYYKKNASRVSVNDIIYSVDTVGAISDAIHSAGSNGVLLNDQALSQISEEIDSFSSTFDAMEFSNAATFKTDLNSELTQVINNIAMEQLRDSIVSAESNHTFYMYKAPRPGIVAYYVDGYENYSIDNFSKDWLFSSNYEKNNLNMNEQITANAPIYKLIGSENWNIIIQISKELSESLKDGSYIRIRFCKDDFSTNAAYTLFEADGDYFMNLSLRTAMIRYISDRFVDIELEINNISGLKIPKSSITSKEFFTIPKEYFVKGGDSNANGIMVSVPDVDSAGGTTVDFITPTIYYENENYYYIDSEYVSNGDVLLKPDSSSTYVVGSNVDSLIGVYNINKGYAVFKQINILYENDEYAIVEPKTSYGIALYDHIALDGSKLEEDQLIKK